MQRTRDGGRKGLTAAIATLAMLVTLAGMAAQSPARRFVGGPRVDRVVGTAQADRILLGAGNDRASAGAGNDLVRGGGGNDRLAGGTGVDRLFGDAGRDRVSGGAGNDRVAGAAGNDVVSGDAGRDSVAGGAGDDTVNGGPGRDALTGGAGADRLNGGVEPDALRGQAGNDTLDTRDGRRDGTIDGGAGRDLCVVDLVDLPAVRGCEVTQAGSPPPTSGGGGSTGGGGGTGGGSGGTTRAAPFALAFSKGTSCAVLSLCEVQLAGTGARNGTVDVELGTGLIGSVSATVNAQGGWVAIGSYGCVDNSEITLRSGSEAIIVKTVCTTPAPPGGGGTSNGALAVTSSSGTSCTVGGTCTFTLSGTGAEEVVNVFPVPSTFFTAPPTTNVNANGTWSATGPWTCLAPADGQLAVADGGSDVPPEAVTVTTTCTVGGGLPPLP